jgi:RHS repeat-associated protein
MARILFPVVTMVQCRYGHQNDSCALFVLSQREARTLTSKVQHDGTFKNRTRVAMQTTVNGTTTLTASIGSIEEVQTTGSTTTTTTYYTVQGKRIAGKVNGSLYFFGYDALGSQVAVLNSSGNLVGSQLYGPYGNSRYSTGTLPTSIGFTGQHADSVTGLDYYVARYYDPAVGQFLSADVVQGNAQGMDPYAYVGGNPETKTDPTGERACAGVNDCPVPPPSNGGSNGSGYKPCPRSNPGCATDTGNCEENPNACTSGPPPIVITAGGSTSGTYGKGKDDLPPPWEKP